MTQRTSNSKYLESSIGVNEFYDHYRQNVKKENRVKNIKEYKSVVYALHKNITEKLLERSWIIRLPFKLGSIGIYSKKMYFPEKKEDRNVFLMFDYDYYNKTGKKAYHTNEHSDNHRLRFKWNKHYLNRDYSFYSFQPSRTNLRALAKIAKTKDGYKRYLSK